jgi:plastocyanin
MRHAILAGLLGATLLAGCGGDGGDDGTNTAGGAGAPTTSIRIADFEYSPEPATVKAGTPITIANADRAPHTLTEEGGSPSFDSDTIKGGKRGSVTFEKAGTFKYYCVFHPTMKGTLTVTQ